MESSRFATGRCVSKSPVMKAAGDWFVVIPTSPLRCGVCCFADVLSIRQFVIVALSGIFREVLNELPVVALGIIEVPTLAVWMCVGRSGLSVSGGLHSLAQGLNVVHLISEVIHPWFAGVRYPMSLGICFRWIQNNVGVIGTHVNPSYAMTYAFATYPKFRKRRLQETDHPFGVTYIKVCMFKPNSHEHLHAA